MLQEDKKQRDIVWWEGFQSQIIRLLYALFGLPLIVWVVGKLNASSLGDPFGIGFWAKIIGGLFVMILFLILPILIQNKLARLRSSQQKLDLQMKLKPFPVETPLYLFLGGIILFPYSLVYPWFGVVTFVVYLFVSELYIRKKGNNI